MRRLATAERIRAFLSGLGRAASEPSSAYLTGGSTAVLLGWRESTIDVDLKLVPDSGSLLRAIPTQKEELERGHVRDLEDVKAMLDRGLVERTALLAFLDAIEDELYRFPAIDPPSFRRAVEAVALGT